MPDHFLNFSFNLNKPLVLACHITGVYDVNRSNTLPPDDYNLVKNWANSLIQQQVNSIIFHNNFSKETCERYQNDYVKFVSVEYNAAYNPNVFRYIVYHNFLRQHANKISDIFVTDISDVVMVNNPFITQLYLSNSQALFCGDEPTILNNTWMEAHSTYLREMIDDYAGYEEKYKNAPLLNCGIVGGNIAVMLPFITKLSQLHQQFNSNNTTAYTGDMGAFNYLARTGYDSKLIHGAPVNTLFKAFENQRTDCWFRHK